VSASRLIVPPLDPEPWPTIGDQVVEWLLDNLVHGPGDVLGRPLAITPEIELFLWRAYEVYPKGHELEARRRFKRVVLSRAKGAAKTEIAALLAIAESHPDAPVRCDGFDARGNPVGRGVKDPYIPMLATTEEQVSELGYGTALAILENCRLGNEYVLGLDRIELRDVPGKIVALAGAPAARDGARTTFQHFDETHHYTAARPKGAHATMLLNIPKRRAADPWSLETTTMYSPGEESVAEDSHKYAEAVAEGLIDDPRLYFDHRQAADSHDLKTKGGLRSAIVEAIGDAVAWTDVDGVVSLFADPTNDKNQLRRVWLNQRRRSSRRWMPDDLWEGRADPKRVVEDGAEIVLSFDGSYSRDSTALVAATVEERPHVFVVAAWEKPPNVARWRTPRLEVEQAIADAMDRWTVVELAPDPPGWHHEVEVLEETYGEVVVRFETNQPARMGPAVDMFEQAIRGDVDENGEVVGEPQITHDGDPRLARHVGNAVTKKRGPHTLISKESNDSPLKIDLAVSAVVAYNRARWHAARTPVGNWGPV